RSSRTSPRLQPTEEILQPARTECYVCATLRARIGKASESVKRAILRNLSSLARDGIERARSVLSHARYRFSQPVTMFRLELLGLRTLELIVLPRLIFSRLSSHQNQHQEHCLQSY